jgi:hypothetical protein
MRSTLETRVRNVGTAGVIEAGKDLTEFRRHLEEVVEGTAFRSSQRSVQFLTYVVEQAIAGHSDSLKERSIGVELFGRCPTYDTGEDAIVRVTASEVRRRLLQHYSGHETTPAFRISLPPGSYVPAITRIVAESTLAIAAPELTEPPSRMPGIPPIEFPAVRTPPEPLPSHHRGRLRWLALAALIIGLNLAMWGILGTHWVRDKAPSASILPWSVIFHGQHPTLLVTSDPNIAEIQGLTGSSISASDYANQQYFPQPDTLPPDIAYLAHHILRGDKASNVDTAIVARVAALAEANSDRITVRAARDLRLSDLDTDNNFIFLGSPRSNPWTLLFNDQMDFRFGRDANQDIVVNAHPRPGEPSSYVPTAKGLATGQSFAIISFIRNPNQAGQILLLAGANAEGTKAAGELITNPQSLSVALQHCSMPSSKQVQHFQLLLRLSTMAGSPTNFNVLACHLLN